MKIRKQFIIWLFEISKTIYTYLFKHHEAWSVTKKDLLTLPNDSFGYHLGVFLDDNNFELIPKVERHDAYHTLTGYSTNVEDEIALQYLSYGNGKRSPYMYGAIVLGSILLPDYLSYYIKSYQIGKQANAFYHLDFSKLLYTPIYNLRRCFFTEVQIQSISII